MQKEEEIELLKTALKKLKKIHKQRYKKELIEDISWIFNILVKQKHRIKHEFTKEELIEIISKKHIDEWEKTVILKLNEELHCLKYEVKNPSKEKVKKFLVSLIDFVKNKLTEVKKNEEENKIKQKHGILSFQNK